MLPFLMIYSGAAVAGLGVGLRERLTPRRVFLLIVLLAALAVLWSENWSNVFDVF
jgi:hypothetical protein